MIKAKDMLRSLPDPRTRAPRSRLAELLILCARIGFNP